jgi:DNA-binding transcriptional ArsR family regulator
MVCNFTQMKIYGMILDETIGQEAIGRYRTWAPITWKEFSERTRVSEEWCQQAVDSLREAGNIETRPLDSRKGKWEYRISPERTSETKAEVIKGRCAECKQVASFRTEFIPEPREFFTTVAAALDHVSFACLAVITRHSHKWSAKGGLESFAIELDKNDFERVTGLDGRHIANGLKKLEELQLIERTSRPGKPALYRSLPENFPNVSARPRRKITPPPRDSERQEKEPGAKSPKNPTKTANTHEIESGADGKPHRYGYCPNCAHIVEVEPVSADEPLTPEVLPAEVKPEIFDIPPPRRAAGSERRTKTRNEIAWETLERWHKKTS